MNDAASDAMNRMARATSSGWPMRFCGLSVAEVGLAIRAAGEAVEHARVDRAGRDRIHPHAERAGLERHRLRQPFDRVFAGGVDRGVGAPLMPEGGRDVDDAAAALSLHHAQFVLHAEHCAQHVGVEGRGVALGRLLRCRAGLALRAGRVDGDVEATEPGDSPVDKGANVILMADVGADELGFGTSGPQFGGEIRARLVATSGNHDASPLVGVSQSGSTSDAGQGAGDENDWMVHRRSPAAGMATRRIYAGSTRPSKT